MPYHDHEVRCCKKLQCSSMPGAREDVSGLYHPVFGEELHEPEYGELVGFSFYLKSPGNMRLKVKRSQTAWAKPSCIVQPRRSSEVQQVIRILTRRNYPFAIRSGGHMPSPLAANINNGVLIDMAMFNGVDYDATKNEARVGAGQRWESVYNALDAYNVTVVGGRVLDVGVGGLILGCEYC